jgi:hypothetical protein
MGAAHVLECRIYAVAEVARGIDEGPVKIEDDEPDGFDGNGTQNLNHGFSVKDGEQGIGNSRAGVGWAA